MAYCTGKKLHKTADGERLPVFLDQADYGSTSLSPCKMVTCPRASSSSSIVLPHDPVDVEPAFTIKRKIRLPSEIISAETVVENYGDHQIVMMIVRKKVVVNTVTRKFVYRTYDYIEDNG